MDLVLDCVVAMEVFVFIVDSVDVCSFAHFLWQRQNINVRSSSVPCLGAGRRRKTCGSTIVGNMEFEFQNNLQNVVRIGVCEGFMFVSSKSRRWCTWEFFTFDRVSIPGVVVKAVIFLMWQWV